MEVDSEGRRLHYPFPAGIYDFISVKDRILGEYQIARSCHRSKKLFPTTTWLLKSLRLLWKNS